MTLCQKKSSGFATFLMKVMTEAGFNRTEGQGVWKI